MIAQIELDGDGKEHTVSSSQLEVNLSQDGLANKRDADVFQIPATEALKAVTTHLTELACITGDVPAMFDGQQQPQSPQNIENSTTSDILTEKQDSTVKITELHWADVKDDSAEPTPAGTIQHSVLVKRFYSKKAPPISLEDYLLRLHKYCPMSTAVYLAASLYITRMVIAEKALFVTPRNAHRLVLAALRVAMKALEDLSYPHARFARVGGVAERELTRLEITFCFLTDFDLHVDEHALLHQVNLLRGTSHVDMACKLTPSSEHPNDTTANISKNITPEASEINP